MHRANKGYPQKCEGKDGSSCGYEWISKIEFPKHCPYCGRWQKKYLEYKEKQKE